MPSIFIIHHGALGDLILTYPILHILNNYSYQAHILCQRSIGKLTCALGLAEKHVALESNQFVSLYSDQITSAIKDDLASYSAILLFSRFSLLQKKIEDQTGIPVFQIPPKPDVGVKIHVAEYLLSRFFSTGLIPSPFPSADDLLRSWGRPKQSIRSTRIYIHPGAGSGHKMWPLPYFIETANLLRLREQEPIFILGPAEYEMQEFLLKSKSGFNVFLIKEILEFVDLAEKGGRFLGNDSGLTHLAAYLGMETHAIFGPSDPERWRPLGQRVKIIRSDSDCPPCFETGKRDCERKICFSGISPERVTSCF